MKIRPYEEKDWQRLIVVHDNARMIELTSTGLEAAYLPLVATYESEGLFEYNLLVAEDSNALVTGFIAFSSAEIAWLYVDPTYQREGIATALLKAAMAQMGVKIFIEVLFNNTGALAFYQSKGFILQGTESGQMPGNEAFAVTCYLLENAK